MWFVPAMMALGTVATIMGQKQQQKQIANNMAWQRYQTQLDAKHKKILHDRALAKLLSEQRVRVAAAKVQFTGTPLLISQENINDAATDWMFDQINRDNNLISAQNEAGAMIASLGWKQAAAGVSLVSDISTWKTQKDIAEKFGASG
jgi:hypothetical protein